jgi:plastocyanin
MPASRLAAVAAALPLILLAPGAAAQPAAQLTVQVWSFGFAPHPIRLRAGQPVTLTFVNQSGSSHDFVANPFFSSARIVSGAAPDGEIDLPGHATRSITLVPRPGTYNAHCSHFLHKQMGMEDVIIVD